MKVICETQRFLLREILATDVDGMYEMDADTEVHKFLGDPAVTSKEQVIAIINFIRQQYDTFGIGRWAVIDKTTKEFMGWAGLKFMTEETNGHKDYYDLGYRLIKRFWGKGIATECAYASLSYAFDTLKVKHVYGMASVDNIGSNRVLRKVGLTFVETFTHEGIEHNWYKIDKVNFDERKTFMQQL
jgi:[ribosomal protein S5]-alanine N-acetyltransferase